MKDSLAIKFLYQTIPGRALLKILVHPTVSKVVARFLLSPLSRVMVPGFIRKNKIDISLYEMPRGGYGCFNDFFIRKKKEKIKVDEGADFVSPSDGLLTVSEINENSIFHIKHTDYSVEELLGDRLLAKEFVGGQAYIFRLTPAHYHRYVFCANGIASTTKRINGILHSVQPICHEKTKVFAQNSREYTIIENNSLGKIVQMEVGALLVGKITNLNPGSSREVVAGMEKGYFEYGGSSIVVLTKTARNLPERISKREKIGDEIPVKVGETL